MLVHKSGVHRKTDLKTGLFICDFEHNGIECKLTFTARKVKTGKIFEIFIRNINVCNYFYFENSNIQVSKEIAKRLH